jgi:hypothetical protein
LAGYPHTLFAPADAVAFGVGAEVDPAERQGIVKRHRSKATVSSQHSVVTKEGIGMLTTGYLSSLGTSASIFTGASPFFLSIPISLAAAFDRSMSRPLA